MKTALVLGCAAGVIDDAKGALKLFKPDIVIACNEIGVDYDRVDAWASAHVESFPAWIEARAAKGLSPAASLWTDEMKARALTKDLEALGISFAPYWEGSTGALAIDVARVMGADRIVLAGVPIDDSEHYDENGDFAMWAYYQRQWQGHINDLKADVRSMSGWTQSQLGAPTKEWLSDSSPEPLAALAPPAPPSPPAPAAPPSPPPAPGPQSGSQAQDDADGKVIS